MVTYSTFLQIAGALAEEGKSLEEITQVAKAAADAMGMYNANLYRLSFISLVNL